MRRRTATKRYLESLQTHISHRFLATKNDQILFKRKARDVPAGPYGSREESPEEASFIAAPPLSRGVSEGIAWRLEAIDADKMTIRLAKQAQH